MEEKKSEDMRKEAEKNAGRVSTESPAAGGQSTIDQHKNNPKFDPEAHKAKEMSEDGDVPKGSRTSGIQSAVDTIEEQKWERNNYE